MEPQLLNSISNMIEMDDETLLMKFNSLTQVELASMTDSCEKSLRNIFSKRLQDIVTLKIQLAIEEKSCPADLTFLTNCISYLMTILTSKELERPQNFLEIFTTFHDCLLDLPESQNGICTLKEGIARACEIIWMAGENGSENFIIQSIPYLLMKSLKSSATKSDIKRVSLMRKAFLLFDYSDPAIESIVCFILNTFENTKYLKSKDGCRFLSFCFYLDKGKI